MFSLIEALSSHGVWLGGAAGWGMRMQDFQNWKLNHHNHHHNHHYHNHQKHHHCHLSRAYLEYWSPASTSLSPSSWCNSCQWDLSCRNITPQSKGFHHYPQSNGYHHSYHEKIVFTIIATVGWQSKGFHHYYQEQRVFTFIATFKGLSLLLPRSKDHLYLAQLSQKSRQQGRLTTATSTCDVIDFFYDFY